MRRVGIVIITLALLGSTAQFAWGTVLQRKPAIRFAAMAPVKITGSDFKGRERVRITLSLNGTTRVKQARATVAGRFVVTFAAVEVGDRCSTDMWARASGARGSLATAKLPQAQCPPRLRGPAP